jgi:hypothetical protein
MKNGGMVFEVILLCMLRLIELQIYTQSKHDREGVTPFFLCTEVYLVEIPKCAFYSKYNVDMTKNLKFSSSM